jgi:acetamidase/formamidase
MATHHLDDTQPHAFWDNSYPARLRIQPGDTVVFETLEASAGQVGPDSFIRLPVLSMWRARSQVMPSWSISSVSNIKVGVGML